MELYDAINNFLIFFLEVYDDIHSHEEVEYCMFQHSFTDYKFENIDCNIDIIFYKDCEISIQVFAVLDSRRDYEETDKLFYYKFSPYKDLYLDDFENIENENFSVYKLMQDDKRLIFKIMVKKVLQYIYKMREKFIYSKITDSFLLKEEKAKIEKLELSLIKLCHKDELDDCSVCYEKNVVITYCKHNLCRICLQNLQNYMCPICRFLF
jgi:hypothetical protein